MPSLPPPPPSNHVCSDSFCTKARARNKKRIETAKRKNTTLFHVLTAINSNAGSSNATPPTVGVCVGVAEEKVEAAGS